MADRRNALAHAAQATDHAETIMNQGTTFSGILKCDGPLLVYGVVEGNIETSGPLIVGKAAKITADIVAHEVGIAGTVVGKVTALDRVEIYPGGKVYGDVLANALSIGDGGIFSGQSTIRNQDPDPYLLQQSQRSKLGDGDSPAS
jgi:cytoskeletal protein CcmA (bactofilin family)